MPDNAERVARQKAQDLINIQERLDQMARRYGEDLIKEACRRYAMDPFRVQRNDGGGSGE